MVWSFLHLHLEDKLGASLKIAEEELGQALCERFAWELTLIIDV